MRNWMLAFAGLVCAGLLVGCGGGKPSATEFSNTGKDKKGGHDHDHDHDDGEMMKVDVGPYHAGLTAELKEMEIDVVFETVEKTPKPVFLTAAKLTGKAFRADGKEWALEFEPAEKKERPHDPDGKCSRYVAKVPWMKPDDKLTVSVTADIPMKDKTENKKIVWVDFVPKKFEHKD